MPNVFVSDPGRFHSTIEDILYVLSKFDTHSIIELLTIHTIQLIKENQWGNTTVNTDSLNKLSILCIKRGENNGTRITLSEFNELNQMVNSLEGTYFPEAPDANYFLRYNIQVGYNQFIFNQSSLLYKICNFWFLYKKTNKFNDESGKSLHSYFHEATKTTFEDYAALVYFIHVLIHDKGTFRLQDIEKLFKKPEYYQNFLEILSHFSKNLTELNKLDSSNDKYKLNSEIILNFNILRDYPFIHVGEDKYICPIPHYWTLKFSTEVYYNILNHYAQIKKEAKPNSTNFFDNPFSNFYGKSLEKLINNFIEVLNYNVKYLSEFQFKENSETLDSADFHLYQNHLLYLIQLKNKRIILKAQSGDLDSYFKDIEAAIIKPYKQSLKLLQRKNYIKELRDRMSFHQTQKIIIVIIYPEDIHGIHLDQVQNFIKEKIQEIKDSLSYAVKYPLQNLFITIEGFEILLELAKHDNKKIITLINEYENYRAKPKRLSSEYQPTGEILYSIEEFIKKLAKEKAIQSNFVSDNFKDFTANTSAYLDNSLNLPN